MQGRVSRRRLLAGIGASTVIAYDPRGRSWITKAQAQQVGLAIPELDGELTVEEAALAEAADDFGHIVHRVPCAVLRPGSIEDVQRVVRFAHRHDVAVAMRGQGHSTYGQAQARAGIVTDTRTLNELSIGPERAVVGPGVRWSELLRA